MSTGMCVKQYSTLDLLEPEMADVEGCKVYETRITVT